MTQRGHIFAIVDEVDSILIDEARTPLIISGPADEAAQLYYEFASIARTLSRDVDYEVDEEKKTVVPLESGIEKVEKAVGVDNIYDAVSVNYVHQLTKALTAKDLYRRDKDYLVAGGEVKISTSSRADASRAGGGPTVCTRRSRPRSASPSRRRTTPGRR